MRSGPAASELSKTSNNSVRQESEILATFSKEGGSTRSLRYSLFPNSFILDLTGTSPESHRLEP